ncbi:EthD domain-containing protein [Patulibacter sp.]|uniref:EthD domain-containing protein n=1 Tax=Patulibacter sp. TaxID=1912859 RepID=UPI002726458D|nr:EthD domain-containing protein [Patulibacter sp.]MDO9410849.1 EthD domain-containing protein [Patulibacter sp.]
MIKVFALIPRRPDVPVEEFHDHWRHPHGDLALRITTMQGYLQSHRLAAPGGGLVDPPYEGIAEVWFDDLATAAGMGEDPNYVEGCHADEPLFIDVDRLAFLMTEPDVIAPGPPVPQDAPGVKLLLLLPADDDGAGAVGPSREQEHELGERLGATRHVLCRPSSEAYADDAPPYGGVRELWWPDRRAYEAGRDGAPDAWKQLVGSTTEALLATEHRVLWPSARVSG